MENEEIWRDGFIYNSERCKYHEGEIKQLNSALFGNGREGLISQVAGLKSTMKMLLGITIPQLAGVIYLILSKI